MYTANDATAHGLSFYARASTRFLVYARDVVQIKNIDIPVIDLDFFFFDVFKGFSNNDSLLNKIKYLFFW